MDKRTGLAIFVGLVVLGAIGNAMKSPEEKARIAAATENRRAEEAKKQEFDKAQKDQKAAEEKANKESAALEIEAQVECESAVRGKLDIPKSADFSIMKSKLSFDGKQFVHYNTFTYKNRLNAELEAAYLCSLDASRFKETGKVAVVSIKIGKP